MNTLDLAKNLRTFCPEINQNINMEPLENWFNALLLSRMLILDRFLGLVGGYKNPDGPAKWFAFQTSCSSLFDPFNTLFQLLILDANQGRFYNFGAPYIEELLEDDSKHVYFCIDQAQCDLHESFTTECPVLSFALRCIRDYPRSSTRYPSLSSLRFTEWEGADFVIAGISLRMGDAISAIELAGYRALDGTVPKVKKHVDFPLLMTQEDFKKLLVQHGILDIQRDSYPVGVIEEYSKPLRGRYRWSVRYIERLKSLERRPEMQK